MKRSNETVVDYAVRLIREDERKECIQRAIWAVHDCGLPPSDKNLEVRRLIATAISAALAIQP